VKLTQPHFAHGALLRAGLAGLLLLHDTLDFGLRLSALGGFGFGVGLVCAALLGGLDLFGGSVVRVRVFVIVVGTGCRLDWRGILRCIGGEARTIVAVVGVVCCVVRDEEGCLFRMGTTVLVCRLELLARI